MGDVLMQNYYIRIYWRDGSLATEGSMKAASLSNLRKTIVKDALSKNDKIDYIYVWSGKTKKFLGKTRKVRGWTGPEYEWTDESGGWQFKRYINPKNGNLKPVERRS